ncbi:MAG: hypothetical protein FWG24_00715 [Eggerthellaceae bacterium]|jgi:hypothetical protein|nr:hypothetical protein [Eggerthellaceae bacterium]MDR2721920.1 hypothetical protein [Coriobacteriaceae bacterium]
MKNYKAAATIVFSFVLAGVLMGCGGAPGTPDTEKGLEPEAGDAQITEAEQAPPTAELQWTSYTLAIREAHDDVSPVGINEVEGRLVRVVFDYVSDTKGLGGIFYGESPNMFDFLKESKFSLIDSAGKRYEDTGSIGYIALEIVDGSMTPKEVQDTFALLFDVPKDIAFDELSLFVEGQIIPIKSFFVEHED